MKAKPATKPATKPAAIAKPVAATKPAAIAKPTAKPSVKLTHRPVVVKQKQAPVIEARREIETQTALFLKAGGKINQIPQGVSGQINLTGQKNIVISKKPAERAVEKNGS